MVNLKTTTLSIISFLVDFKVYIDEVNGTSVQFDVSFASMSNFYGSLLDFSTPLIHIYVDTNRVEGSGNTIMPGKNYFLTSLIVFALYT